MAYTDIDKPSDYFNTKLYTGNGSTQSITGVGFQPDLVWWKSRGSAQDHQWYDVIRGVTKAIESNKTTAEYTQANGLTSFNSDGFTVGDGTAGNASGDTFASWNWLASNTTASNTDGSITSTVSANTTSGFSIVSWTGSGSHPSTIGHGLGAVPQIYIVKARSELQSWYMYNANLGNNKIIELNTTSASYTDNNWNSTTPTSSVFTVNNNNVNENTQTYIAYCFVEKKGFSRFGSYVGNGSNDGSYIHLGFKPAFVMFKNTDALGDWTIQDSARDTFNLADARLYANLSNAENDGTLGVDFLSNGIKIRTSSAGWNTSAQTSIYMAFAENPFVTSTKIPTTAR